MATLSCPVQEGKMVQPWCRGHLETCYRCEMTLNRCFVYFKASPMTCDLFSLNIVAKYPNQNWGYEMWKGTESEIKYETADKNQSWSVCRIRLSACAHIWWVLVLCNTDLMQHRGKREDDDTLDQLHFVQISLVVPVSRVSLLDICHSVTSYPTQPPAHTPFTCFSSHFDPQCELTSVQWSHAAPWCLHPHIALILLSILITFPCFVVYATSLFNLHYFLNNNDELNMSYRSGKSESLHVGI